MNDTISSILQLFSSTDSLASSEVHKKLAADLSLVTIKRALTEASGLGLLDKIGSGRSVRYSLSRRGALLKPYDVKEYLKTDQENRHALKTFNSSLFSLPSIDVINQDEYKSLEQATKSYTAKAAQNKDVLQKELSRFIVEMAWKSAQIEGNTYTLLDTEQLLLHGIKSPRNTEAETQMILNQRSAFDFIYNNLSLWSTLTLAKIEEVHKLIVKNLGIPYSLRKSNVGITGTEYTPLSTVFQIREAMENLIAYQNNLPNVYEKALILVLGLSYIQPFSDGNKRTSRMIANSILLEQGYAPISYRAVEETAYKESCLVFYEQNSIQPFKKLFIEQYIYSASNYNISRS